MSYEPTTWVTGDIITATKLNNIESGVQSVSSSYTPTTWATGDIITAVKLNNIEQGIANAGGGSSDFSTAAVTLTNTDSETDYIDNLLITLIIDELLSPTTSPSTGVATTPLYKGECIAVYMGDASEISVSGNATYNDGVITITGDCTITVS